MTAKSLELDRRIIERYLGQPSRLPPEVRVRVEEALGGPVRLYAMLDLDEAMTLTQRWVALGDERVAVARRLGADEVRAAPFGAWGAGGARAVRGDDPAREAGGPPEDSGLLAVGEGPWHATPFPRAAVRAVREEPGLSATLLHVLGEEGRPPLAELRYTHRQRRAVENLRFVLEQQVEGRWVETGDPDAEYAHAVAGPVREAQALVAGGRRRSVLWRLLSYLEPYRRALTWGFVAAAVITLVSLVPPWLAGYLIDEVVRPVQDGSVPLEKGAAVAWLAVAAMAGVYLVRQGAALVRLRLMAVLGEYVARDLRAEVYEHLQKLSMSFFSRKKTGSLITRVTSDTDRLWEFLAFGVVDVSLSLVMLLGLSVVLLSLDWRLGLVMVVPVPAFCWMIWRHGERMEQLFLRAWRKWSRMTDVLGDTIPGIKVVKAFSQERRETGRFGERNVEMAEEANRLHQSWTTFWPLLVLGVHGTSVLVWAFAMPRLLGTGAAPTLSPGTFVSFLLYTGMFMHPVEVIGQMSRTMNRATSSAHRVFEVLDTEPEVVDVPEPVRLEPVEGRVAFEDVSFAYDGVRQVLKGVSFDVEPGEMIGLVGPSGGGKTTVVNLIARFYDVTGGRVTVDGVDVRKLDQSHYRRQVGMVLQDPYLFHGSVLENIRYGHPEASLDQVIEAARAANAHDFIAELPHGYETVVGERGQTLSGGERQRVSIARAILHDPRILILDEATSAVDTETEREIQEAMDRLVAGRTVFAIAHRLSTLVNADRLFVMKDGRLVERGTHAELLENEDGIYRKLHELQKTMARAV